MVLVAAAVVVVVMVGRGLLGMWLAAQLQTPQLQVLVLGKIWEVWLVMTMQQPSETLAVTVLVVVVVLVVILQQRETMWNTWNCICNIQKACLVSSAEVRRDFTAWHLGQVRITMSTSSSMFTSSSRTRLT
jgi:hypothetical protein